MRTVVPIATKTLHARAYFARAHAKGWVIATDGTDVLVLDHSLSEVGRLELPTRPEDVSLSADGSALTVAGDKRLTSIELRSGRVRWDVPGTFGACRHTTGLLWAAECRGDEVTISIRDPESGRAHRTTTVADPFGESAVLLFQHPNAACVVAWVAAGQDGQIAHLVSDEGTGLRASEIAPRDRLAPIFLSDAASYLSASDEFLEHLTYPHGERISAATWPYSENDDLEDAAGYDVQILPGRFASWSSREGRIYVVDLDRMKFVDELVVAGHPVVTAAELFPNLVGDRTPCTDFQYAEPGPEGLILTVHARTQLAISRIDDWSPDPNRDAGPRERKK